LPKKFQVASLQLMQQCPFSEIAKIAKIVYNYKMVFSNLTLRKLIEASPFLLDEEKEFLLKKLGRFSAEKKEKLFSLLMKEKDFSLLKLKAKGDLRLSAKKLS
ncbi:MAG: hypothetical protein AAB588_01870, partial [Patescibacteria group bacterium]